MVAEKYFPPHWKDLPINKTHIGAGHLFTIVGKGCAFVEQNGRHIMCKLDDGCQLVSDEEVVVSDGGSISNPRDDPHRLGLRSCTEILLTRGNVLKTETGEKVILAETSCFILQDNVDVAHTTFPRMGL